MHPTTRWQPCTKHLWKYSEIFFVVVAHTWSFFVWSTGCISGCRGQKKSSVRLDIIIVSVVLLMSHGPRYLFSHIILELDSVLDIGCVCLGVEGRKDLLSPRRMVSGSWPRCESHTSSLQSHSLCVSPRAFPGRNTQVRPQLFFLWLRHQASQAGRLWVQRQPGQKCS